MDMVHCELSSPVRIYALYARSKCIAGILFAYVFGELVVGLWIYLTPSVTAST